MDKLKAILVDVISLETKKAEAYKRLEELESLVNTYGGIVVLKAIQKKGLPNYETYIGKGKVEEIFEIGKEKHADLLIVNNILKPRQIFNLEEIFRKANIKVWDRIDLILKIFSKHAQTSEAKLQIELASIEHMGPRIFGMGIELSRQPGAMAFKGGPGEANIEIMKRHLRKQKENILKKLKHYDAITEGHRERRKRENYKTAAIVGYTNTGKSTLLNTLTKKGVYVADKLFATLDSRIGKLFIQPEQKSYTENSGYVKGKELLVADTIGFIRDLPPSLIQAFKSTLSETIESDLILHVIDAADSDIHTKIAVVEEILVQLGVSEKPKIYVFNKIDLIESRKKESEMENQIILEQQKQKSGILKAGKDTARILGWVAEENKEKEILKFSHHNPEILKRKYKKYSPVFISAEKKMNIEELIKTISKLL